jgi:phosphonate transport system permease protein
MKLLDRIRPYTSNRYNIWAFRVLVIIGLGWAYIWSLQGLKIDPKLIQTSLPYMTDFLSRLWPPDLSIVDVAIKALIETVQMSLWGTTIGAILSIPLALLSAQNLSPLWLRWIANLLQNTVRSVPSIILGLFFVAATGCACGNFGFRNLYDWLFG